MGTFCTRGDHNTNFCNTIEKHKLNENRKLIEAVGEWGLQFRQRLGGPWGKYVNHSGLRSKNMQISQEPESGDGSAPMLPPAIKSFNRI